MASINPIDKDVVVEDGDDVGVDVGVDVSDCCRRAL
jgi:hypothetical protein